jgi:hypothetical protein
LSLVVTLPKIARAIEIFHRNRSLGHAAGVIAWLHRMISHDAFVTADCRLKVHRLFRAT